ncbi:winged helix-turn-helix domain-containing protein [Nitrososphaera viennensis]
MKSFDPDIRVLCRLAEAFSNAISLKKTHLHLASRLRWDLFNKYIEWLCANNYVLTDGNTYCLTSSGKEMFAKCLEFNVYLYGQRRT